MSELTDFLLARIAEDEARARRAGTHGGNWVAVANTAASHGVDEGWHVLDHSPARVLAEVEAKREIVGLLSDAEQVRSPDMGWHFMKAAVRALAQPFADHPDFREEWKA